MNKKNVKQFTDSLYELVCVQNIPLKESLEIMGNSDAGENKKKIINAAQEIYGFMLQGLSFSAALSKCTEISFDVSYVTFISFSELTGKLSESISFLKRKNDEQKENSQCLIGACVYPVFVIFLAVVFCTLLIVNGNNLVPGFQNLWTRENQLKLIKNILLLICISIFSLNFLLKNLNRNKTYEAFVVVNFLIESGMNMSIAFSYAALVLGETTKEGKLFMQAKDRLSLGMDLKTAFGIEQNNYLKIPGLKTALYYAQKGGSKENVFEKVAATIKEKDDQRRKICLSLIEPLLIGITGMLLIVFVINLIQPVLMNTGLFL